MGPDAQGAAPSWDPHCGVGPWGSAGLELLTSTPRGGPALPCGRSLLPRGQPFPCSAAAPPPIPLKASRYRLEHWGWHFPSWGTRPAGVCSAGPASDGRAPRRRVGSDLAPGLAVALPTAIPLPDIFTVYWLLELLWGQLCLWPGVPMGPGAVPPPGSCWWPPAMLP